MNKNKPKRVFKKISESERQRIVDLQNAIDAELPEIKNRARQAKRCWDAAREAIKQLREERERQGLSLADVRMRTEIGRESLCKLENNPSPNPTFKTLSRYADALGLDFEINFTPKK